MNDVFKRIAINLALTQRDVEEAVNFSLDEATKAARDMDSIEISGWGTFYIKNARLPYIIKSLEEKLKDLKFKKASDDVKIKIEVIENSLELLGKRYEHKTDN